MVALRPVALTGDRLDAERAEQLRQIVTEALSNVLRHARARTVRLRLASDGRRLRLEIADDGVGFELPAATIDHHGQGLANMRLRAEQMGGRLETWSRPGRGTRVSLTMPLTSSRQTR